jgi:catechol 2,3-dioxygenase-like lactoylglutathione lyase family enzyme
MSPNGVDGLAVVLLLTQDTARTAAFYRDVLGLPLEEEEHGGRHRHYACRLAALYFTIQHAGDLGAGAADATHDSLQLCFTVADMTDFLESLKAKQARPLHPPRAFEHTVFTTLRDPDGRAVRVMTPWGL